jgi:hypothetical protein
MAEQVTHPPAGFVPIANVEVESVTPSTSGFLLHALGQDAAEYLLEMHLDMPIDRRTQTVLGELLAQSEWRVWRRTGHSLKPKNRGRVVSP